jgi:hypothetical protein
MREEDGTRELHAVATDQPGLILHRPYQKLRQIAVVYALLPLLCAALGGFVVIRLAEANTDRRLATLEGDLAERRKIRQQEDAARDAQTRELLALVCTLLDHSQPRDAEVEKQRVKYGCTGGPIPTATPAPPTPSEPGRPSPGGFRTTAGALPPRPAVTATTSRAVPTPTQDRPPPPSNAPPGGGGSLLCVDLPLLPPICL